MRVLEGEIAHGEVSEQPHGCADKEGDNGVGDHIWGGRSHVVFCGDHVGHEAVVFEEDEGDDDEFFEEGRGGEVVGEEQEDDEEFGEVEEVADGGVGGEEDLGEGGGEVGGGGGGGLLVLELDGEDAKRPVEGAPDEGEELGVEDDLREGVRAQDVDGLVEDEELAREEVVHLVGVFDCFLLYERG